MILSREQINAWASDPANHYDAIDTRIRSADEFLDAIRNGEGALPQGRFMPWSSLHGHFDLRANELTVWAGESGCGKSLILGQVMAAMMAQGENVMIASMEMTPLETIGRMLYQCAGSQTPSWQWVERWIEWAKDRLYVYDQQGLAEAEDLIKATLLAHGAYDCKHVVIDSLTKVKIPHDGPGHLTAQTDFINNLQYLCKNRDIHMHLVAHFRKPDSGQKLKPGKYEIRGASQITDLADNVIVMARNHAKEEAAERLMFDSYDNDGDRQADREKMEKADAFVKVDKQRATGVEKTFRLWHNAQSKAFSDSPDSTFHWDQPW